MNYQVYILYSPSTNRYYRGISNNLLRRFAEHNKGQEQATKSGTPWYLAWFTSTASKSQAMLLEKKLKNIGTQARIVDFISRNPAATTISES